MNKKGLLLMLAGLCIVAAAAFAVVGMRNVNSAATYENLMSLGEVTFYAQAASVEEDGTYTIYYVSEDGLHTYARDDVGKEEYDSYNFDVAVSMNEDVENPPQSRIKRYVYTYRKDGEFREAIYDAYKTPYEVSQLIEDGNRVSSVRYYVFAGLLLLCGGYFIFLAFSRGAKPKEEQNA